MRNVRPLRRFHGPIVLLALVALASGCASSGGDTVSEAGSSSPSALASGDTIGALDIDLSSDLPQDALDVAEQFSMASSLDERLRSDLAPSITTDGSLALTVEIVGLRVRSTGSAIWWGVMAGADTITARVDVLEGGRSIKTFETGTSTALGGFVYGARGKRIDRLLNTLSERIAAGL